VTRQLRIGVDIGGTFTDFSVLDDGGNVLLWKEESTPQAPESAIESGLDAIAGELGISVEDLLSTASLFVHGTTIGTNILIQRNGPAIGLLCTDGFRDILYYRDGHKPERFNIHLAHPEPLVPRHLRIGVPERIGPSGEVVVPLDEEAVRGAARRFRAAGVEAIAVAFLWSVMNADHERRAAELLAAELTSVHVVCSADILPEIREWERTSATVLSAYVVPAMQAYLRRLERSLGGRGLRQPLLIMQVNGGCTTVDEVVQKPVTTLASGPAAAPAAATFHGSRLGLGQLITVDMGGTSFDVCVVSDGRPTISRLISVEHHPIGVPGVEVHSVGAGGGSIAWVDAGGALRVGPISAGARPGPAAYGQGGDRPTVTDANVALGYLAPEAFLGGRRALRRDLAEKSITNGVAAPLGLDLERAALGILRVVDSNMAGAIRAVSIERGVDPRNFSLVVGGGAGGLHATRIAREIGVGNVIIPREAGAFCAFGMTVTDVRRDYAAAYHVRSTDMDIERLKRLFDNLEREAVQQLRRDGFAEDAVSLERFADARYPGQVHEITIPVSGVGNDVASILEAAFHAEHRRRFTYDRQDLPVEILHWRVTAYGRVPPIPSPRFIDGTADDTGEPASCQAYLEELGGWCDVPVYDGERLARDQMIDGPAVIRLGTTTILLHDGDRLSVSSSSAFVIAVEGAAARDGDLLGSAEV
jgi:N-methylhydantoinase A